MENLPLFLYLIEVFNSNGGAGCLGFICAMIAVVVCVLCPYHEEPHTTDQKIENQVYKMVRSAWLKFTILLMISWGVLLPSKEGWYTILAAYGVTEIAANPALQKTAGKSLEVLNKAMEEYLGEKDGK